MTFFQHLACEARATEDAFRIRVRSARIDCGYSQRHVAELMTRIFEIPWHQTVVAKVENGDRAIKLTEAWALSVIFNIGENSPLKGIESRAKYFAELLESIDDQKVVTA